MSYREERLEEFVELLERHTPEDGYNQTAVAADVGTFRVSERHAKVPEILEPAIIMMGQGRKTYYLGSREFDYGGGDYIAAFLPMTLEATIYEASPERPMLVLGMRLDLQRIASMLLKIDQSEGEIPKPEDDDPTGMFAAPLDGGLLDAAIRLLRALDNPAEAEILGDSIVDEIHYRVLRDDHAGALRFHLQQREQVQQMSRAVEYIHANLDQVISVDELAECANMSTSAFHRSFKEVMRLSPLQYAKSMKLHKAQTLIQEGKRANEAGYLVGYNSPAQFSREYKRFFGYSPSAT